MRQMLSSADLQQLGEQFGEMLVRYHLPDEYEALKGTDPVPTNEPAVLVQGEFKSNNLTHQPHHAQTLYTPFKNCKHFETCGHRADRSTDPSKSRTFKKLRPGYRAVSEWRWRQGGGRWGEWF